MRLKKRIVAWCPQCVVHGVKELIVPVASIKECEDYLCVNCWRTYTTEEAKSIQNTHPGTTDHLHKTYVATNGYKCKDGREFSAYMRLTGTKLKHIKQPLK